MKGYEGYRWEICKGHTNPLEPQHNYVTTVGDKNSKKKNTSNQNYKLHIPLLTSMYSHMLCQVGGHAELFQANGTTIFLFTSMFGHMGT